MHVSAKQSANGGEIERQDHSRCLLRSVHISVRKDYVLYLPINDLQSRLPWGKLQNRYHHGTERQQPTSSDIEEKEAGGGWDPGRLPQSKSRCLQDYPRVSCVLPPTRAQLTLSRSRETCLVRGVRHEYGKLQTCRARFAYPLAQPRPSFKAKGTQRFSSIHAGPCVAS
ncbi:hypothetical protein EV126DRAFT_118612 [Verticillium dahliae]|nr:hypothetical protein EV126DRAFT_118612 [Verticillium dahliae]